MKRGENETVGPITDFLVKDHGRLEGLLQSAVAHAGSVDQGTYDQFRAGLLRHIGMEEKILLPAAQRLRGGGATSHRGEAPARPWGHCVVAHAASVGCCYCNDPCCAQGS